MSRVRENVDIEILDTRQVQFIEEDERALEVDVVICGTVHNEEAHTLREGLHVVNG